MPHKQKQTPLSFTKDQLKPAKLSFVSKAAAQVIAQAEKQKKQLTSSYVVQTSQVAKSQRFQPSNEEAKALSQSFRAQMLQNGFQHYQMNNDVEPEQKLSLNCGLLTANANSAEKIEHELSQPINEDTLQDEPIFQKINFKIAKNKMQSQIKQNWRTGQHSRQVSIGMPSSTNENDNAKIHGQEIVTNASSTTIKTKANLFSQQFATQDIKKFQNKIFQKNNSKSINNAKSLSNNKICQGNLAQQSIEFKHKSKLNREQIYSEQNSIQSSQLNFQQSFQHARSGNQSLRSSQNAIPIYQPEPILGTCKRNQTLISQQKQRMKSGKRTENIQGSEIPLTQSQAEYITHSFFLRAPEDRQQQTFDLRTSMNPYQPQLITGQQLNQQVTFQSAEHQGAYQQQEVNKMYKSKQKNTQNKYSTKPVSPRIVHQIQQLPVRRKSLTHSSVVGQKQGNGGKTNEQRKKSSQSEDATEADFVQFNSFVSSQQNQNNILAQTKSVNQKKLDKLKQIQDSQTEQRYIQNALNNLGLIFTENKQKKIPITQNSSFNTNQIPKEHKTNIKKLKDEQLTMKELVEQNNSYIGDAKKPIRSPLNLSSGSSRGMNASRSKVVKKDNAEVLVGSFQDYQNKNSPVQVVINYNGCQMNLPTAKDLIKSAQNVNLRPQYPNSIKISSEKQKLLQVQKINPTNQVYYQSKFSKETKKPPSKPKRSHSLKSTKGKNNSTVYSNQTLATANPTKDEVKDNQEIKQTQTINFIEQIAVKGQIQVQPLRTKQPSANHSRKPSIEKNEVKSSRQQFDGKQNPQTIQVKQNDFEQPKTQQNPENEQRMKAILRNFCKKLTKLKQEDSKQLATKNLVDTNLNRKIQQAKTNKIPVQEENKTKKQEALSYDQRSQNPTFVLKNANFQNTNEPEVKIKVDLDSITTAKRNNRQEDFNAAELSPHQILDDGNGGDLNWEGENQQNDQQKLLVNALDEFLSNKQSSAQDLTKQVKIQKKEAKSVSNKIIDFKVDFNLKPKIDKHKAVKLQNQERSSFAASQKEIAEVQKQQNQDHEKSVAESQFNAAVANLKLEEIKSSNESDYDSQYETIVDDPLIEEKRYLVTMIYTSFTQLNKAVTTTKEFYRIGNLLGQGAFGKVNLAQHILTGHFVAIKSLRKQDLNKQAECKRRLAQEIQILQNLVSHKNIVKLYDSFETDSHLCFVMELCAGGDLLSYVRRRKKLDESQARYFFTQIASGLAYCHKNLVVHRDIKLENLLIDEEGQIKICDFGVSRLLDDRQQFLQGQCGTPAYMAPEMLQQQEYDGFACDVWSLGVCLFAMVVGAVPFRGKSIEELNASILRGELMYPEHIEKTLSKDLLTLLQSMLHRDPRKRIKIQKVLKHKWLAISDQRFQVFNQPELKKIKQLSQPCLGSDEPQRLLTEVNLSQTGGGQEKEGTIITSDMIHALKEKSQNNSSKSCILAPFNSTIENKSMPWIQTELIRPQNHIKYSGKVREANRQYEFNYNEEVDNGIIITHEPSQKSSRSHDRIRRELEELEIFKRNNGNQKHAMVSPNVSNKSYSDSQKSLNMFIEQQMINQHMVIDDNISTYRSQSDLQDFQGGQKIFFKHQQKKILNNEELTSPKAPMVSEVSQASLNQPSQLRIKTISNNGNITTSITQQNAINKKMPFKVEPKPSFNFDKLNQINKEIESPPKSAEEIELSSTGSQKENIDMLIVCKIENEFGYPEEYILQCLEKTIKNDATTCYYLLIKEDKHEIVNLLAESPAQSRNL